MWDLMRKILSTFILFLQGSWLEIDKVDVNIHKKREVGPVVIKRRDTERQGIIAIKFVFLAKVHGWKLMRSRER